MSMSQVNERIVRIPATTSAPYTVGSSRVNVLVPSSYGVVDMSKSYLEAQVQINSTDGDNTTGEGIYNVNMIYNSQKKSPIYNVALVKNCKLSSDKSPLLEETQSVNLLRNTLNQYTLTRGEKLSREYNSLWNVNDRFKHKGGSVFRVLNGEGEEKSVNQLGRVPIHLSQLFGMGKLEEVDLMKTGDLNFQVELDIGKLSGQIIGQYDEVPCNNIVGDVDTVVITAPRNNIRDVEFSVGDDVILKHGGGKVNKSITDVSVAGGVATITLDSTSGGALNGVSLQRLVKQNLDSVSGDTDSFVLSGKFENLEPVPFWVGQKVRLTQNIGANDVVTTTIKSISRDQTTAKVTVVLNDKSGGALADAQLEAFVPAGTSTSVEYLGLSIVLYQKMSKDFDHSGGYRYLTYITERANGNGNTNYNDSFILPPSCVNNLLMFDYQTLVSNNLDVSQYRVVLDQNNLTDRQVVINDPLYYDELNRTLMNIGEPLKSLNNVINADLISMEEAITDYSSPPVMIPNTIPLSNQNKILQVQVEAGGSGVNNVVLYKQVERNI